VKLLQGFEGSRFLLARLSVEKDSFISLIAGLNKGVVFVTEVLLMLWRLGNRKRGFGRMFLPMLGLVYAAVRSTISWSTIGEPMPDTRS